jgi:Ca2+/Na+ antiporter
VHDGRWSLRRALGSLLVASLLAAWMSEILVGAAEGTGEALGMSPVFIGIVFLAIVGGAAESSSAIAMALKNKVDLTMGIALGSSIQIALFVAPVLVLASYFIAPQPLELSFSRAEVGALFMAAIIGTVVAGDGRANWYKGVQLVVVYLVIALMFYFIPTAAAAQETRGDRWAFTVTPYLWLPNVNGTLKYNPPPAGTGAPAVDTGPNNYLENLSMALMLSGEARKGRWSIVSDLVYIDFDGEKSNVRAVDFGRSTVDANGSSRSSLTGVEWTLAGGYTVLQTSRATLDAIGGFRYFHVNASSSWQLNATVTGPGAGQTFPASGSISRRADIWDGIVGVRGRVGLGEGRWFVPYYLDVGTGSSSLTWQSLVGVGYGFKWGDLVLAYRTLAYDQSDDKLFHDFRFSGTTLGASFRF